MMPAKYRFCLRSLVGLTIERLWLEFVTKPAVSGLSITEHCVLNIISSCCYIRRRLHVITTPQ